MISPVNLRELFSRRYPTSGKPSLYRAPGRVNLIGEHTDYNLGFVMPIAIDMACYAAVARGGDPLHLRTYSEDLLEGREYPVNAIAKTTQSGKWVDYVIGVAQQLLRSGVEMTAKDLLVHSTVPIGAGLSSSAALEVASALALVGDHVLDRMDLVRACHRAENEFVGLPSGIMDQFISVFGKANRALMLDCRSLEYEEVELPANVEILAVNTMVKHELGGSAYRERVAECARAVAAIQRKHERVSSLRDATLDMLEEDMPETIRKRARHVITENERVHGFAEAARAGHRERMGKLFIESHRSLQFDYEVSCAELDFLVDSAIKMRGVFGARMTGGGFGGCTVNLVDPAAMGEFQENIAAAYRDAFGRDPQIYQCHPSEGAGPQNS